MRAATQSDYSSWRTLCESGLINKPTIVEAWRGHSRKSGSFRLNITKKGRYISWCKYRSLTWHPWDAAGWTLKFSDISLILLLKSEDGFDLNEFGDLDSLEVVKYVTS
jgi:hypothetical protein